MKLGIFINYAPNTEMRKEGLGRYLGGLINGFIDSSNEVTIVCPVWSAENVKKLLGDYGKKDRDYTIVTNKRAPVALGIYKVLKKIGKPKTKKENKMKKLLKDGIKEQIRNLAKQDNVIIFVIEIIIMGILSIPILVLLFIARVFRKILRAIRRIIKIDIRTQIKEIIGKCANLVAEEVMQYSAKKLVNMINNSVDKQDIWYVPALFWPQVNDIKDQKVVINVPDLVTENFASSFSDYTDPKQTELCRRTIQNGKYFITYCEYIGEELLEHEFGIEANKWRAIYHSNHDLSRYIGIGEDVARQMNVNSNLTHVFAKAIIPSLGIITPLINGGHLAEAEFIFYSSQWRPNKNMLNLIKAYEYLIRKRFRHEKLVLTGNIYNSKELEKYIDDHDLREEVIICHGVSMQQLAALYCCAKLVVNPTLYEGGFPFTFGEGMSVGTPSVMSDIPQVRRVLEPAGLEEMMFNPRDYIAIAEKMDWALDNLDYLKEKEQPLYDMMAERKDDIVAEEYINVFEQFVS